MNNKLVGISIGIIGAVAFLVAAFFWKQNNDYATRDTYWELKLVNASHRTDTTFVPVEPETVYVKIPAKPSTMDYQAKVDSAFNAGLAKGVDSLRSKFDYTAQVLDTLYAFKSGDRLADYYEPLTHDWRPTLYPAPRLAVYDTIYYPLPPIKTNATLWQMGTAVAVGAIVFEGFRAFVLRKP